MASQWNVRKKFLDVKKFLGINFYRLLILLPKTIDPKSLCSALFPCVILYKIFIDMMFINNIKVMRAFKFKHRAFKELVSIWAVVFVLFFFLCYIFSYLTDSEYLLYYTVFSLVSSFAWLSYMNAFF
jgi:hypothetical protein